MVHLIVYKNILNNLNFPNNFNPSCTLRFIYKHVFFILFMDNEKMKNDKFILMGLDDDKTGHVAEVLKNKTCKKILDFLAETREASEKDISDSLKMPINTVEYNLKKLIKSGFVVKTKNFFWSVKGKKIPMYKLARKHIIISPNKTPSLSYLKSILPVIIALAAVAIFITIIGLMPEPIIQDNELNQFSSQSDLNNFIKENSESSGFWDMFGGIAEGIGGREVMIAETTADGGAQKASPNAASDYSTTNIQVQGVDEADIIKNDGKYIYVVSGNKIIIIDSYPAENMNILSEIELSNVRNIFINDNKLIVFSNTYSRYYEQEKCLGIKCVSPDYRNVVYIYDISDKENPELESEIAMDGDYTDSRMIGNYVYVISNKYIQSSNPEPPAYIANGVETKIAANDVYYWNYPDTSYTFTSIMAININGDVSSEVFLTGRTNTIFVSQDNIYLTYQKRLDYKQYAKGYAEEVALPLLPSNYDKDIQNILDSSKNNNNKLSEIRELVEDYSKDLTGNEKSEFDSELIERLENFEIEIQKKTEKTIIHKINVDKDEINYQGIGEVPGRILNQFSMDEYDGYFRIATTTGQWGENSLNHVYVLDEDLEIIGKLEDLAEGERIFSARFLGNKVYLVTFEAIDPLFVISLENPKNPEVLGYLKIPGYSDYLHPYDENHVIGIGKEVDASIDADKIHSSYAIYYTAIQGVKVSLFDVSDVSNPIEKDKFVIGERGTESPVLNDHKALLFDKEKNLLVLPVKVSELKPSDWDSEHMNPKEVWQGAYVFNINENGLDLRGTITHDNTNSENDYLDYKYSIQRSLFMDDILYTISQAKIKANDLDTIDEINSLNLGLDSNYNPPKLMKETIAIN